MASTPAPLAPLLLVLDEPSIAARLLAFMGVREALACQSACWLTRNGVIPRDRPLSTRAIRAHGFAPELRLRAWRYCAHAGERDVSALAAEALALERELRTEEIGPEGKSSGTDNPAATPAILQRGFGAKVLQLVGTTALWCTIGRGGEIDRDVLRTFPDTSLFATSPEHARLRPAQVAALPITSGLGRLRRLLVAYALAEPDVLYCQGMNYVAGVLLRVAANSGPTASPHASASPQHTLSPLPLPLPSTGRPSTSARAPPPAHAHAAPEQRATSADATVREASLSKRQEEEDHQLLTLMLGLGLHCSLNDVWRCGLPRLRCFAFQLAEVMKARLPLLHEHVAKIGFHYEILAAQWLLTLMTTGLPFPLLLRIWDLFFVDGWKVFFRVIVFLLSTVQGELLECDIGEVSDFFRLWKDAVSGECVRATSPPMTALLSAFPGMCVLLDPDAFIRGVLGVKVTRRHLAAAEERYVQTAIRKKVDAGLGAGNCAPLVLPATEWPASCRTSNKEGSSTTILSTARSGRTPGKAAGSGREGVSARGGDTIAPFSTPRKHSDAAADATAALAAITTAGATVAADGSVAQSESVPRLVLLASDYSTMQALDVPILVPLGCVYTPSPLATSLAVRAYRRQKSGSSGKRGRQRGDTHANATATTSASNPSSWGIEHSSDTTLASPGKVVPPPRPRTCVLTPSTRPPSRVAPTTVGVTTLRWSGRNAGSMGVADGGMGGAASGSCGSTLSTGSCSGSGGGSMDGVQDAPVAAAHMPSAPGSIAALSLWQRRRVCAARDSLTATNTNTSSSISSTNAAVDGVGRGDSFRTLATGSGFIAAPPSVELRSPVPLASTTTASQLAVLAHSSATASLLRLQRGLGVDLGTAPAYRNVPLPPMSARSVKLQSAASTVAQWLPRGHTPRTDVPYITYSNLVRLLDDAHLMSTFTGMSIDTLMTAAKRANALAQTMSLESSPVGSSPLVSTPPTDLPLASTNNPPGATSTPHPTGTEATSSVSASARTSTAPTSACDTSGASGSGSGRVRTLSFVPSSLVGITIPESGILIPSFLEPGGDEGGVMKLSQQLGVVRPAAFSTTRGPYATIRTPGTVKRKGSFAVRPSITSASASALAFPADSLPTPSASATHAPTSAGAESINGVATGVGGVMHAHTAATEQVPVQSTVQPPIVGGDLGSVVQAIASATVTVATPLPLSLQTPVKAVRSASHTHTHARSHTSVDTESGRSTQSTPPSPSGPNTTPAPPPPAPAPADTYTLPGSGAQPYTPPYCPTRIDTDGVFFAALHALAGDITRLDTAVHDDAIALNEKIAASRSELRDAEACLHKLSQECATLEAKMTDLLNTKQACSHKLHALMVEGSSKPANGAALKEAGATLSSLDHAVKLMSSTWRQLLWDQSVAATRRDELQNAADSHVAQLIFVSNRAEEDKQALMLKLWYSISEVWLWQHTVHTPALK